MSFLLHLARFPFITFLLRRQTRSQTKTALKKTKVLTRGKEDEISRSKSNLSALVDAEKKKKGGKKEKKEESEEEK